MYLGIRTDSNTTYLSLTQEDGKTASLDWESGRELSDHLLTKILQLMDDSSVSWEDLQGIIVFTGPGSFTGLRIGATVANTIAYAKKLPIVGVNGDDWLQQGGRRLDARENDKQVIPHYGAEPNITKPKR